MRRLSRRTLIAIAFLGLFPVQPLFASLSLTIDTNSVSLPFSITDYNSSTGAAQIVSTSAQTLTIFSNNRTWTLSVRALTSTFSFVPMLGDPNPNKPASDLAVRAPATSSSFLALTTTDQLLSSGPKSGSNQTRSLDYRLDSNLATDPPGTYTISIIYTVTQP